MRVTVRLTRRDARSMARPLVQFGGDRCIAPQTPVCLCSHERRPARAEAEAHSHTSIRSTHVLQTVALRAPALFRTRSHSSSAARAATSAFLCCCANKGGRSRRRSRRRSRLYLEVCCCSCRHRSRHRQRCSWSRSWRCSRSRNLESSPRRTICRSRNRTRRTQSRSSCRSRSRSWRCSQTFHRNPTDFHPSQEELHEPSQESSQSALHEPEFSCRRSRAPSAPPVIADSFDERDEVWLSQGSPQPSTAESVVARWTSIANRGPCIDLSKA